MPTKLREEEAVQNTRFLKEFIDFEMLCPID